MKCSEARKILYLSEYPEVVSNELVEAKRHAHGCRECAEFVEGEKAFGAALRASVKRDRAPGALKRRILEDGQGRRKERKFIKTVKVATIAAAALLVFGLALLRLPGRDEPVLFKQIVSDHIQFLPSPGVQINSKDPSEIKKWFVGRVDFAVNAPAIAAELRGGRLCFLDGRRLALLFYERNSSQVSVFVSDAPVLRKNTEGKEVVLNKRKTRFLEDRGYNLAVWQDGGLTYALVSELSVEEIKKML